MSERPATIGELKVAGWVPRTVKEEIRGNVVARLAAGQPLIGGIVGYDDTVFPQLANALLAGHDVIFLGERGQGKTRIIRALTGLLDEWLPIVAGSEINDDPFAPVSRYARDLVAELGDDTAISWVHRDQRYGEKLATPDTSIADLIGEVDPIRVAEGRYLSDELTLHYGLVPRTNRGIFAVNELPDLAERIQVGLLNALEEHDVQVRGYQVRVPLDVMFVASANPEDYTSRGRLITPLKDRFGSQIRTHYPLDVATELAIMDSESRRFADDRGDGPHVDVAVPEYLREVVAMVSQAARSSAHVNQRSGVSVRLSVTNLEVVVANSLRRGLVAGETSAVARVDDLSAMTASSSGKIEIETLDDGAQGAIFENLVPRRGARRVPRAGAGGADQRGGPGVRGGSRHRRRRRRPVDGARRRVGIDPGPRPPGRRTHRWRRLPGGDRRGCCLRARRVAPVEAAEQGPRRRPCDVPVPLSVSTSFVRSLALALSIRSSSLSGFAAPNFWRRPAKPARAAASGGFRPLKPPSGAITEHKRRPVPPRRRVERPGATE